MTTDPEPGRQSNRRWLGRLIIGLAMAILVVGSFTAGVLVGEIRGAHRVQSGEPVQRPWPLPPRYGWKGHRGGHGALGVVDEVQGDVIVITGRWNNRLRIIITEETIFRRGREAITLADIRPGDRIAVIGRPRGTGEIEARVIWVLPESSEIWQGMEWHPAHRLGVSGPSRRACEEGEL